jgi:hypothetical protein
MKLEAVGGVSMRNVGLEICWKIDDVDGTKRAFFGTDATTNTQTFGNEGDLRLGSDFDTEPSASNDGAGLLALLSAFLYRVRQNVIHSL